MAGVVDGRTEVWKMSWIQQQELISQHVVHGVSVPPTSLSPRPWPVCRRPSVRPAVCLSVIASWWRRVALSLSLLSENFPHRPEGPIYCLHDVEISVTGTHKRAAGVGKLMLLHSHWRISQHLSTYWFHGLLDCSLVFLRSTVFFVSVFSSLVSHLFLFLIIF